MAISKVINMLNSLSTIERNKSSLKISKFLPTEEKGHLPGLRSDSQGLPPPPPPSGFLPLTSSSKGQSWTHRLSILSNQSLLLASHSSTMPRHPSLEPQDHLWVLPLLYLPTSRQLTGSTYLVSIGLWFLFSPRLTCEKWPESCWGVLCSLLWFGVFIFLTAFHWDSKSTWSLNIPQTHALSPLLLPRAMLCPPW